MWPDGRYYEIQPDDVGKPFIRWLGRVWMASNFIGRIMPCDVGKRVFLRSDHLVVESKEQLERRD